jgi:hypothetical protein
MAAMANLAKYHVAHYPEAIERSHEAELYDATARFNEGLNRDLTAKKRFKHFFPHYVAYLRALQHVQAKVDAIYRPLFSRPQLPPQATSAMVPTAHTGHQGNPNLSISISVQGNSGPVAIPIATCLHSANDISHRKSYSTQSSSIRQENMQEIRPATVPAIAAATPSHEATRSTSPSNRRAYPKQRRVPVPPYDPETGEIIRTASSTSSSQPGQVHAPPQQTAASSLVYREMASKRTYSHQRRVPVPPYDPDTGEILHAASSSTYAASTRPAQVHAHPQQTSVSPPVCGEAVSEWTYDYTA